MTDKIRCPHCHKAMRDDPNALFQHVKAKHGAGAAKVFRQPRREDDGSVASELVDALQSGERPAHLVDMFPEEFSNADLR